MSRFRDEVRVIPKAGWIVAASVYAGLMVWFHFIAFEDLGRQGWELWQRTLVMFLIPLPVSLYVLVIAYVYGDARRRQMRYVLWTLLAIFVPSGLGVILYLLLRDPMPGLCPVCGAATRSSFVFCPRCGTALNPACPQCRRAVQPDWAVCAYCGTPLQPAPRAPAAQRT